MSQSDILPTLLRLAEKRFGDEAARLAPDADFFDALGIDSFQAMELLTDLEEAFDVEIPDYEVQGVSTFAGLAEVIGRRT